MKSTKASMQNIDQDLTGRQIAMIHLVIPICLRGSIDELEAQVTAALGAGMTTFEIKELLIQLTIYAGFPKVLEAMNKFKQILQRQKVSLSTGSKVSALERFNFFKLPEVSVALKAIDPDFAHFALLNAVELCDRPGLTAQERALIILASDICNEVFEGPFQIHLSMAEKSGVTPVRIQGLIRVLANCAPTFRAATLAAETCAAHFLPSLVPAVL